MNLLEEREYYKPFVILGLLSFIKTTTNALAS